MEAVGLAAGVVGLAGLFTACIDCFELVQRGRYLGKEFFLLETKFANQRLRLVTWGRACGFTNPDGYDPKLDEERTRSCIQSTLLHLFVLFSDGRELRKRYGLKLDQPGMVPQSPATATLETAVRSQRSWSDTIVIKLSELKDRARSAQNHAGLARATRWAIEDKRKFTELVQHLKDLIDDLEGLTSQLGIKDRQQEIIRWEVESISDIATLESMEEARAGNADAVSDAASLRLWNLRDQFLPSTPENTNDAKSSQKSSQSPSHLDWEDITGNVPSSTPAKYQILHRVTCDHEKLAIYLDPPSYHHAAQDEWVVLEPGRSTYEPTVVHLAGKRRLLDFGAYMSHNEQLLFVLIKDYKCNHDVFQYTNRSVNITSQQVHLASAEVISSLEKLARAEAGLDWWPHTQSVLILRSPFTEYFHLCELIKTSPRLQRCRDRWKTEDPNGFGVFIDFMEGLLGGRDVTIEGMISRGTISWRYLIHLYIPGAVLIKRDPRGSEYTEAYEQTGLPYFKDVGKPTLSLEIPGVRWAYDGNFQRMFSVLSIPWSLVGDNADREVSLASLPVVPLCHATEISASDLRARGEKFWKCRNSRYISFSGHLAGGRFIEGCYVVDNSRYAEDPNSQNFFGFKEKLKDELGPAKVQSETPPGGNFLLLLPFFIVGFDLAEHIWLQLLVTGVSEIEWDSEAFDQLLMDRKSKELLRALVVSPLKHPIDARRTHSRGPSQELKRQVILFHGGPGCGKTLSAEAIAQLARKPLCRLKMGRAGVTAAELDKVDKVTLRIVRSWDCVFLIEAADHILQASDRDPNQSSMASAFLRYVDSFNGILIVSTSRVGTFDEAFMSRVTLAVHFPSPTQTDRRIIWERCLKKSLSEEEWDDVRGELDSLSQRCRNGREIQNVISTARTVANYEQRNITFQLLVDISESTRNLEMYLDNLCDDRGRASL